MIAAARHGLRLCAALVLAAGCSATAATPEAIEIGNMRPVNLLPKSSPARLVGTFDRHCVRPIDRPDSIGPGLEAVDYVRVPGRDIYVVDDRRPSVQVVRRGGAVICAVAAAARTGQTARLHRYVSTRFPDARRLRPAPAGIEAAWRLPGGQIELARHTRPGALATLTISMTRVSGGSFSSRKQDI